MHAWKGRKWAAERTARKEVGCGTDGEVEQRVNGCGMVERAGGMIERRVCSRRASRQHGRRHEHECMDRKEVGCGTDGEVEQRVGGCCMIERAGGMVDRRVNGCRQGDPAGGQRWAGCIRHGQGGRECITKSVIYWPARHREF
ncbi:hypothetical protein R1sor_012131 [Riccia sorocarpa]|uniref:Uncharacterized protein n=1 Tax=Riccia sorocarpa TaxID=122646 RepID=A0ABD3I2X5_9MARC